MRGDRQWVVEADTPEGPIEMSLNADGDVTRDQVVERLVDEHANETGLRPEQIRVTDAWSVEVP